MSNLDSDETMDLCKDLFREERKLLKKNKCSRVIFVSCIIFWTILWSLVFAALLVVIIVCKLEVESFIFLPIVILWLFSVSCGSCFGLHLGPCFCKKR
jgi:hypothetical protein